MNIILYMAAGIGFVSAFVNVFGGPFMINKELRKYTAVSYIVGLATSTAWIVLAGHVLGWW